MAVGTISAAEVGDRFFAVAPRIRKTLTARMDAHGLSLPRTRALEVIAGEGPIRLKYLAGRFDCTPASVTDMVDGLERDGLAQRRPDPSDRRASLVTVTPAGQAALDAARVRMAGAFDAIFSVLDQEERLVLLRALDALSATSIVNGEPV